MRPTDENQQSTRPNLMSSGRRGGNEESILAMLERDAGRGGKLPASRLALYGAGAAVAVALVAALVWLAREQNASEVIVADAPLAVEAEAAPPRPASHGVEAAAQRPTPQAATIVDEPQPPAKTPQQQDVPPLVLLTPPQAAEHASAGHASVPPAAEIRPVESAIASAKTDVRTAAAPETSNKSHPITTVATHAEPKHSVKTAAAARQESARPRSAAKPAGAPTRVASHHAASRQAAKQKKQAAQAQPAEAVDSDVALISAVIQHASNRANAAGADCGAGANCAANATPGH